MRLGRNDPCWCGSGIKYKKCHMLQDSMNPQMFASRVESQVMTKWIKTPEEIEGMKKSGAFNGELMDYIKPFVKHGINTAKLDKMIREYTYDHGHIPACLNYRGYPKSSCISPNEIVCHGIPNEGIVLNEGDIVNIDITTIVDGFHGDQSETLFVGEVSEKARFLTVTAANAMVEGISCVRPGTSFAQIGDLIENYVVEKGFSVVVDFTGHGIGKEFHEEPPVYHFRNKETAVYQMASGMTFTIEPMVNEGTWRVDVDRKDRWTVRTQDRKLSAQFEHTILVTDNGFEVLTLTPSQKKAGKLCHLATHPKNELRIEN